MAAEFCRLVEFCVRDKRILLEPSGESPAYGKRANSEQTPGLDCAGGGRDKCGQ